MSKLRRTKFPKLTRTRFIKKFKIFYRQPNGTKWKRARGSVIAESKRQAAFIASKHLTGKWIRPVYAQ